MGLPYPPNPYSWFRLVFFYIIVYFRHAPLWLHARQPLSYAAAYSISRISTISTIGLQRLQSRVQSRLQPVLPTTIIIDESHFELSKNNNNKFIWLLVDSWLVVNCVNHRCECLSLCVSRLFDYDTYYIYLNCHISWFIKTRVFKYQATL